jgi:excisionase family DNA binding protein
MSKAENESEGTPRLLSTGEAAERIGITAQTLRDMVARREIRAARRGRHLRFDPADIDAYNAASWIEPEAKAS